MSEKILLPNGAKYEGELKNGVPHGHGTITYKNNDYYTGGWKNGIKNGEYGVAVTGSGQNEHFFTGTWKDGYKNGKCHENWKNGTYRGEFKNGKRNGHGEEEYTVLYSVSGPTSGDYSYIGHWKDGKRHGQGQEIQPGAFWSTQFFAKVRGFINRETIYTGGWKDGKKHGKGEIRWYNPKYGGKLEYIKTTWKDGKKHGIGTVSTGMRVEEKPAEWRNGELIE